MLVGYDASCVGPICAWQTSQRDQHEARIIPSYILGSKCCNQVCNEDPAMLLNLISICSSLTSVSLWNVPTVCHQTPPYLGPHSFALAVPQEVGGCTHELISAGCKSADIFLEYWTLDLFPCLHTYFTGLVHQRMLRQLMLNIGAFSSVHVCGCYLSYPLAPSETPWHGFYSVLLNRRYNHYKWVVVKTRGGWNIGSPIIMRCSL